jgi:hypothetical protein
MVVAFIGVSSYLKILYVRHVGIIYGRKFKMYKVGITFTSMILIPRRGDHSVAFNVIEHTKVMVL